MLNFMRSPRATASADDQRRVAPWRRAGVEHEKSEVRFDFYEKIDMLVDEEGEIVEVSLYGDIIAAIKISGTPVFYMGLNEPDVMKDNRLAGHSVALDIISYHESIARDLYKGQKVIKFVPPDDSFQLLKYFVSDAPPVIPMWITATERIVPDTRKIVYHVKLESRFPEEIKFCDVTRKLEAIKVSVRIPVLKGATDATFHIGYVLAEHCGMRTTFSPEQSEVKWDTSVFPAKSSAELKITLNLPREEQPEKRDRLPVTLNYYIPRYSLSGLKPVNVTYHEHFLTVCPRKTAQFSLGFRTTSTHHGCQFKIKQL